MWPRGAVRTHTLEFDLEGDNPARDEMRYHWTLWLALLVATPLMACQESPTNPPNGSTPPPPPPEDPVFPGENWEVATPESRGVDSAELQAALDYLASEAPPDGQLVRRVMIIKDGRAIHQGPEVNVRQDPLSVTKSYAAGILGLLIGDGRIALDDRASEYVAAVDDRITVRHLATMTSGYDALPGVGVEDPNTTPFTPAPLLFEPGSKYRYYDDAWAMLGNVLRQAGGEDLDQLVERRLLDPMQYGDWRWVTYDQPGANGTAVHKSHSQLSHRASDAARWGLLWLSRGNWDGTQLLSQSFVDMATSAQVPAGLDDDDSRFQDAGSFGFAWLSNDNGRWPRATSGTYCSRGFKNNRVWVIPEWDMVIVRWGVWTESFSISEEVWDQFLGMVGEAVGS